MKREITGHTALYCLLGSPVAHSISPQMHNASFLYHGIDARYLSFDVKPEDLKKAIDGLRVLGVKGFNLTMPLKREMIPYCDRLSPAAEICGAVNTVVNENGVLTVVVGNNAGANGEGDILTVTGKMTGKVGAATAEVTEAVLSGYDGDGESYLEVSLEEASASTTVNYNLYDVNHDGVVNQLDLTRAQRYYGTDNAICDVNKDGTVDINDIILILNNYTK